MLVWLKPMKHSGPRHLKEAGALVCVMVVTMADVSPARVEIAYPVEIAWIP